MTLNFDQFLDQAAELLNINLRGYKIKRVQRRTDSIMRRYNIDSYDKCLKLLEYDLEFKNAYLDHFTINTSEFYRNPKNFKYLQNNVIAELFKEHKKVKIWSAPCSNGSEPYSLAIMLTELSYNNSSYQILASDIDVNILKNAEKAIYNTNSIQNIPEDQIKKYFEEIDSISRKYKLNTNIIKKVTFEKKDLINEPFKKDWHLILSRNFFIYLTSEIKDMLTHKFVDALTPGGYLFLGNTEFIFNPERFGLEKVHSSFYRKLK